MLLSLLYSTEKHGDTVFLKKTSQVFISHGLSLHFNEISKTAETLQNTQLKNNLDGKLIIKGLTKLRN